MNISPMQLMQIFKSGNPQQMIQQLMKNNQIMQNPMISNAVNLANQGKFDEVERIARNMCQEKGIDADDAVSKLKQQFGV